MRYISAQLESPIRIVALSASLANAKDVGEWIGATSHGLFNFPPGVRPVPLEIRIQGFDIVNLESRMQAMLRPCYAAITGHARDGKPAIVFVPTRRHAKAAALDLLTHAAADGQPHRFRQVSVWVGEGKGCSCVLDLQRPACCWRLPPAPPDVTTCTCPPACRRRRRTLLPTWSAWQTPRSSTRSGGPRLAGGLHRGAGHCTL